jgi:DNA invertase Pin-like site-specific DNA recombinase
LLTATRAALYLRVSTVRQAEHDLSIPDQKTQMQAWVAQHAGPSLPGTSNPALGYRRQATRVPAHDRAHLRRRERFDVIVAHSFSRLFRDAFGLEFYLRKLAKHGVRLVSITEELGDDPAQVMMRQVIALFDEYQSKENAKHVLRSVKENALERRPSAVRLYGGQGCAARQPDRQRSSPSTR